MTLTHFGSLDDGFKSVMIVSFVGSAIAFGVVMLWEE